MADQPPSKTTSGPDGPEQVPDDVLDPGRTRVSAPLAGADVEPAPGLELDSKHDRKPCNWISH